MKIKIYIIVYLLCIVINSTAQPRIESISDLPYTSKAQAVEYGKQLCKRLQTPPDTVNNEWERYTVRYINTSETPFSGDLSLFSLSVWPLQYYWDTMTIDPQHRLAAALFYAYIHDSLNYVFLPYDISKPYSREEVYNLLKEVSDELLLDIQIWTDSGYQAYKIPFNYGAVSEIEKFIVIEKSTRTKKARIEYQLLAVAPMRTYYEDQMGYSTRHKVLCWILFPQ